ncbi:MAG: MFS transporter, partial [Actinobacteria bacterium]|nr:MFS transporter [Actinomycetota bacterium]
GITGTAYLHPAALAAGFRTAVLIAAGMCVAGGLLAAVTITNPPRAAAAAGAPGPGAPEQAEAAPECLHCGLEAPPLTTGARPAVPAEPRDR